MFEIAGDIYYFDLEKMSEFVRFEPQQLSTIEDMFGDMETNEEDEESAKEVVEYVNDPSQMIDITKWEMAKVCVETILNEGKVTDNKMGIKGLEDDLSLQAKLAFNTLHKYKIITNDE
jgi:hypothetical protein